MTVRDRLKRKILEILKYTNNPEDRRKLGYLIQEIDTMSDSKVNALYHEMMKASDMEEADYHDIPDNYFESQFPDFPSMPNSMLPPGFEQGGIMDIEKVLRSLGKEYPLEHRRVEIRHDPRYGTIVREKHVHEIDCPHIDRKARVKDLYGHMLCGAPECAFRCVVCWEYACEKCALVYRYVDTNEVAKAYHLHHSSWWYRWRYK